MITFRYKEELSGKAGKVIKRPVADVFLKSKSGVWIEFHPYIDSGADITLIPLSLGRLLGFTIKEKKIEQIGGIQGSIPVIYFRNKIKIGMREFLAQIAWGLIEEVPPLLGRKDVFDLFIVTFRQKEEIVTFR